MKQWFETTILPKPLLIILITAAKMILIGNDYVSAYAGIHYFAGRKQNASPNKADNRTYLARRKCRLAHHLQKYVAGKS
jgi:hypothetical protein